MNHKLTLMISSLLSIVLFTFHWTDEIARGMETGKLPALGGVLFLITWLFGTLVVADRRSGHVIMLLASVGGVGVLVLHMTGAGMVSTRISNSGRVLFWVWTLIMLGLTSSLSAILAARGLWSLRRGGARLQASR